MRRALPILLGLAALLGVLVLAFTGDAPPEQPPRDLAHFAEFDRLVKAAWTGDKPLASVVARDLTAGPEGEGVAPEAQEAIGGALGFVGFAEDAEELTDAVARAAAGCGACHAAAAVPAPPRPAWSHETSGAWLAHGLVWDEPALPPEDGEPVDVTEGWHRSLPEDTAGTDDEHARRVARAWATCAGCHARETALPE